MNYYNNGTGINRVIFCSCFCFQKFKSKLLGKIFALWPVFLFLAGAGGTPQTGRAEPQRV